MARRHQDFTRHKKTSSPKLEATLVKQHALILADIEGIIGVHLKEQCTPGSQEWKKSRPLITADINAAIEGALRAGCTQVTVIDMHGTGFNLLPEELLPQATLIQGHKAYPIPLIGKMPKAHKALFIGWHAARDQQGFSPHIFHKKLERLSFDQEPVTEVELFSAVLGEHGIPVVFVSGEDVATQRIEQNMPWIKTFEVPKRPLDKKEGKKLREALTTEIEKTISNDKKAPLFPWGKERIATLVADGREQSFQSPSATQIFAWALKHSALDIKPWWLLGPALFLLRTRCRFQERLRLVRQKKSA